MQRSNPFARAASMMSLIAAAMALPPAMRTQAMADIGPYESRGKGRNASPFGRGRHGAHMTAVRTATKARNVRRHKARAH